MNTVDKNGLKISLTLYKFINDEVLPGTKIKHEEFWQNFSDVVHELSPINKSLVEKREQIQKKIDEWHKLNKGKEFDKSGYIEFLKSIDYLIKEENDFKIETSNVDKEITSVAGPQLVVPVDNARYALNAANARWVSLYDSLYGTDIIPGEKTNEYNIVRANKVREYVKNFFNQNFPLIKSDWQKITKIIVEGDKLVFFSGSEKSLLKDNSQFVGYNGDKKKPNSILIKNNNLHIDIIIDPETEVGKDDKAHISDVIQVLRINNNCNEDSVLSRCER